MEGNARLTAATGAVLFVLLAVEGFTLLAIAPLLSVHLFVGLLVVPPVLLKLASTGYRFVRYYTGDPGYRLAGAPELALRLVGPLVVVSTVAVLASGIGLWLFGDRYGRLLLEAHKVSFVVWFLALTVHVLGHLGSTSRLALADVAHPDRRALTRGSLVVASLLLGLVVALAAFIGRS